jgi:hypothetical protein
MGADLSWIIFVLQGIFPVIGWKLFHNQKMFHDDDGAA